MSGYDAHFQIRWIYFDALDRHDYAQLEQLNRNEKGYYYEMRVQDLLHDKGLEFNGNSADYEEWLKHTNTGFDIKMRNPKKGSWTTVECKLILKQLYPSWFLRDWLGRSAEIIVTNNPWAVPYKFRKLLRESGKKMFSTMEFLFYIQKLSNPNKYNLNIVKYSNSTEYDRVSRCSFKLYHYSRIPTLPRKCTKYLVQILESLSKKLHMDRDHEREMDCTRFLGRLGVLHADIH